MHLLHSWEPVERTGHVVTLRCSVCHKTRVRVRKGGKR